MDYYGNYLALMYGARKFNEPVAVSLENNWRQIKVFGLNDTCTAVPGRCVWRLELFDGTVVEQGEFDCKLDALTSKRLAEFDFKNKIEKSKESQGVFVIRFYNQQGDLLSQRRAFLYRENACTFPDAGLETEIAAVGGKAVITVKARQYARFVALDMESCHQPFSDNYFDLSAGESAAVEIEIPPQWSREEVQRRLRVHSLADVEPQMS
ncbi:MAG: hypothetical protein LIO46_01720, partial [Clostridiales bacterium]|nr:hypothetical protein [Clostridiales bacterium]